MRIAVVAAAAAAGLLAVRRDRRLAWAVAALWVLALIWVAFLIRRPYAAVRVVFDPFHALKLFLKNLQSGKGLKMGFLEGAALNLLMFVPAGYLLPVLRREVDSWWKAALWGFCLSLVIELLQLVTRLGMFDLDDLMNNTLGAVVGWLCAKKWLTARSEPM